MPPVRRHNEQLQLVAVSGAEGRIRWIEPQWQEPCSDREDWLWFIGVHRCLLGRLTRVYGTRSFCTPPSVQGDERTIWNACRVLVRVSCPATPSQRRFAGHAVKHTGEVALIGEPGIGSDGGNGRVGCRQCVAGLFDAQTTQVFTDRHTMYPTKTLREVCRVYARQLRQFRQ